MGLSELYSTFFREFVLGAGFSGFWGGVLQAILGRRRRRGWAILPRNSGVFGWRKGAARRFSARRTVPGRLGKKIFKNFLERGGEPKNGGVEGAGRWTERTLYRVCEVIFGSGS